MFGFYLLLNEVNRPPFLFENITQFLYDSKNNKIAYFLFRASGGIWPDETPATGNCTVLIPTRELER